MARIQLRDVTIYLQDGLAGTTTVDDVGGVVITDTDVTIDPLDTTLNTDITDQVPIGARFQFATADTTYTVTARTPDPGSTTNITFTPPATAVEADDSIITFFPQRLSIKIGEGDLSWTEAREYIYDLDRDQLDTVRQGQDQPVSVDLAFTYESVTAETADPPTPVDALKRIGNASEWVNSATDPCEPYAVDIIALNCVPCGTDEDENLVFPDFRFESLDYSIQDASIAVSGQCNTTDVSATRLDDPECP